MSMTYKWQLTLTLVGTANGFTSLFKMCIKIKKSRLTSLILPSHELSSPEACKCVWWARWEMKRNMMGLTHGSMKGTASSTFETTCNENSERTLIMKVIQKMILMWKMIQPQELFPCLLPRREREKGTTTLSVLSIPSLTQETKFSLHIHFHTHTQICFVT